MSTKPLGGKSYGHIPHLPGSRMGPADHKCTEGQLRICCEKKRDRHDWISVSEKLDGSNVAVSKVNGVIVPLTRAGYHANSSPFEQHHMFAGWVSNNYIRFDSELKEGERFCGEWLAQAHGTRYELKHEPFVAFDLMLNTSMHRALYDEFCERAGRIKLTIPRCLVSCGDPLSIEDALKAIQTSGHGALDPVEGAVWRVERNEQISNSSNERRRRVDFLAKYVRLDKIDGCYLPEVSKKEAIWNWRPNCANT